MSRYLLTSIVVVSTAFVLWMLNRHILKKQEEHNARRLEFALQNSQKDFTEAIEQFGVFSKGLQAFLNGSNRLPTEDQVFDYLQTSTKETPLDSMVHISVLDTSHTFLYSMDQLSIDPLGLKGKSLQEMTGHSVSPEWKAILQNDKLYLLGPHNLLEGGIGTSLNFRIVNDQKVVGYVNAVIKLQKVMNAVYDQQPVNRLLYHFSTGDGVDFDREIVYNDEVIDHDRRDPAYYKNFDIPESEFVYSSFYTYGFPFKLGVALREDPQPRDLHLIFSLVWFATLLTSIFLINRKSASLEKAKDQLQLQQGELAAKNDSLTEMNKAKDRFMSILSHDIKGPLHGLANMIQLRKSQSITQEEVDQYFEHLNKSSSSLISLVDNVMEWIRLNDGKIQTIKQDFDFAKIISSELRLLEAQAQQKGVQIDCKTDEPLWVSADKGMMSALVRNLVSNAIKFTEKGGSVSLVATRREQQLSLSITDTGVGMSKEELATLFVLDREFTNVGTAGEQGTGLGMTLVKEYVEMHQGTIDVKSQLNQGTEFTIIFPELSPSSDH